MLSLFKRGTAKLFKEQYVQPQENKTLCRGNNFGNFLNDIHQAFKEVGRAQDVMTWLQIIQ